MARRVPAFFSAYFLNGCVASLSSEALDYQLLGTMVIQACFLQAVLVNDKLVITEKQMLDLVPNFALFQRVSA